MRLKINVTQDCIDAAKFIIDSRGPYGVHGDCCPIAIAMCLAGLDSPSVPYPSFVPSVPGFTYNDGPGIMGNKRKSGKLPPKAKKFIKDFDDTKTVKPFIFYVNI